MEDNSLNIHHRNMQKLVTEIFKIKIGVSPDLMNVIFELIEKTIISTKKLAFQVKEIHTTKYGIETPS